MTPGGFQQANESLGMAYRTALAVIEGGGQGRRERRDNDTRWDNLLIGERIS
jgi:hypothetical protein